MTVFVITNILKAVGKGIQSEIQQTKPFTSLEDEALVTLQRTADRLHWRLSEMLKPHGLSPTQYNALRILRGAGDQGRACSEIAERMINRDPDITRLVDRLERGDWRYAAAKGMTAASLPLALRRPVSSCCGPWMARSRSSTGRCWALWANSVCRR